MSNKFIRYNYGEYGYLNLIKKVIKYGEIQETRNGITRSLIGETLRFDLRDNKLPLLTTKKMAWKTCLKELLWFIHGKTDNKILINQNVKIWNGNGSREFLDSRGLFHLNENDLGPVYGHQWRYFNAKYKDCETNYDGEGIDQLNNIINMLKDDEHKHSRRIIMSAWNPIQIDEMALPPCHVLCQFHVNKNDELSCSLYQRSGDIGLGIPFNIASYSFLTHLLGKHCNLKPKEFIHHIGNAHIYESHLTPLLKQLKNKPLKPPSLNINILKNDINDYKLNDFIVENYTSYENISMDMVV